MKALSSRVWRYLGAIAHWLFAAEPRFWITIVVLMVAAAIAGSRPSEPVIRWIGLALQLLGIGASVLGILQLRVEFGRPSVMGSLRQWLRRFPTYPVTFSISGDAGLSVGWGTPGSHDTWFEGARSIEDQLEEARKNIALLRNRIKLEEAARQQSIARLERALDAETRARLSAIEAVREKMETAHLGGLGLALMGIAWLSLGLIMDTVPAELACLCLE
jgi:hypothetical protein